MVKLVLKFKDVALGEFPVTQTSVTVGRSPNNDIVIDNALVSRHHLKIVQDGSHYIVEDLGSGNGTLLNGQAVVKETLRDQDEILVGKHTVVFIHTDTPSLEQQKQQTPDLTEQTFVLTKEQLEQLRKQSKLGGPAWGHHAIVPCLSILVEVADYTFR